MPGFCVLNVTALDVNFQQNDTCISAVSDVSFHIASGETVALVGESGSGKSLTSLSLMRLLPLNAVYGEQTCIDLDGQAILDLPEYLMRGLRGRRVAMIFQEPMTALNPVLTVGQQLAESVRRAQKIQNKDELTARMIQLLHDVDIPEPALRLRYYPHQLSGGQKQRVVIAMALAGCPDLLIADEPTTALDVTVQAQILALLKGIQKKYNMSMLLITHDLGVVKAMAQRVYVMYAGQIVESADVELFFKQPLHPYAQQLLASLPSFAGRLDRLFAIPGRVPSLGDMPNGCRFHPRCAHVLPMCSLNAPYNILMPSERQVRCHLYPEHIKPPTLHQLETAWLPLDVKNEVVLSVKSLSVDFASHHAVDDVSFELKKGKTLALVGESGCGKSTVSRAILGLQPLSKGAIIFNDQAVSLLKGQALKAFRKDVQIIFQDPYAAMNPRMTIGEILAEGMEAQGFSSKRIKARQQELLDQVNLPLSSLNQYPHQFSGGQRQRICIARALAVSPRILICDEPTSALDVSVQAQILNLLKSLQQELHLSYLFITHNFGVVSYLADDVLVMHEGKIVERGSCEEILRTPQHTYTRQLLEGVLVV